MATDLSCAKLGRSYESRGPSTPRSLSLDSELTEIDFKKFWDMNNENYLPMR